MEGTYAACIDAARAHPDPRSDELASELKALVEDLQAVDRAFLGCLFRFLFFVAGVSGNKMNHHALAVVWSPSLLMASHLDPMTEMQNMKVGGGYRVSGPRPSGPRPSPLTLWPSTL